jgi:hypothetical protein
VLLETYAFLTRNRPRVPVKAAAELLRAMPGPVVVLSVEGQRQLLDRVGAAGPVGGAVDDALIGATVLEAGTRLLSRDERAAHLRVDRRPLRPHLRAARPRPAVPVPAAVGSAPAPPQISSTSASSSAKEALRARSRASIRFRTWACP